MITKKTRIIALSHVQFTGGFKCNLEEIGNLCKAHNIDFFVDAAQSLGCLPVLPESWNISCIAASGWKWLHGPIGSGILYTSRALRDKIQIVAAGADLMKQGQDYLNHTWDPYLTGKMFEYSTPSLSHAAGLAASLAWMLPIKDEIPAYNHDLRHAFLNASRMPYDIPDNEHSGILSFPCPAGFSSRIKAHGITCTERGGYIRIAPHFGNTIQEMERAGEIFFKLMHS